MADNRYYEQIEETFEQVETAALHRLLMQVNIESTPYMPGRCDRRYGSLFFVLLSFIFMVFVLSCRSTFGWAWGLGPGGK